MWTKGEGTGLGFRTPGFKFFLFHCSDGWTCHFPFLCFRFPIFKMGIIILSFLCTLHWNLLMKSSRASCCSIITLMSSWLWDPRCSAHAYALIQYFSRMCFQTPLKGSPENRGDYMLNICTFCCKSCVRDRAWILGKLGREPGRLLQF